MGMPLITHPLAQIVLAAAIEVHRELGPGLLESPYGKAMCFELHQRNVPFRSEVRLPVTYKGVEIDCGFRLDLMVGGWLGLEIKSVETTLPLHMAQAMTYLKLSGARQVLLINFNVTRLVDGVKSLLSPLGVPPVE